MTRPEKVVVGLSGGIDSAAALILLKDKGFEPVGVSLILPAWKEHKCENSCCTDESLEIAKDVCSTLGIEYHQYDESKEFKSEVVDYFINSLKSGKTPNPCVICNRNSKFRSLIKWADEHDIYYVSTGHYAKNIKNVETDEFELFISKDIKKDQTYTLSFLKQEQLKRCLFPLGEFQKSEIIELIKNYGFDSLIKKKESQNFCFVPNNELNSFIKENLGESIGDIRTDDGKIIGKHKGLCFYTIGQRKGLGFSTKYYVLHKDIEKNELIVTSDKEKVSKKSAIIENVSFISDDEPEYPINIRVKTRYQQDFNDAVLNRLKDGTWKIDFKKSQSSVTPGQFAVFYEGDRCLGAGEISLY